MKFTFQLEKKDNKLSKIMVSDLVTNSMETNCREGR